MFADLFQFEFIRNAVIAGILISIISSLLGVFVIQRKMSFLGSGLSHSALGGIGFAILIGIEPLYIAVPFTIIVALLITQINKKTKISIDAAIGILFSAATALGIIFISLKTGYVGDAYSYLFGTILAISNLDVVIISIFLVMAIIIIIKYWGEFAYITFDRELAISDGINVNLADNLLSILLAISIVISIKIVGIVLISAFLVLPAAIARLFANTFSKMTIISIIIGCITTLIGLYLSFILDLPTGATIIMVQAVIFGGVTLCRKK